MYKILHTAQISTVCVCGVHKVCVHTWIISKLNVSLQWYVQCALKWVYHCTAAWAEGRREAFREEVGERERERGRERERETE